MKRNTGYFNMINKYNNIIGILMLPSDVCFRVCICLGSLCDSVKRIPNRNRVNEQSPLCCVDTVTCDVSDLNFVKAIE